MADYWKSQARKFCDFCKCWIADNKPSIQFHETGKRHKENVTQKLAMLTKKSVKEQKASIKVDEEMRKMEEAAMKAYMKDIESNPDYTSKLIIDKAEEKKKQIELEQQQRLLAEEKEEEEEEEEKCDEEKKEAVKSGEEDKVWYEAKSDEGYTYYWNYLTGESIWEPPEEGYLSIAEQQSSSSQGESEVKEDRCESKTEKKKSEKGVKDDKRLDSKSKDNRKRKKEEEIDENDDDDDDAAGMAVVGPSVKPDPYGRWKTVEKRVSEPVDLQLPEQEYIEIKVPVIENEQPQFKFKEKIITSLGSEEAKGPSTFKKRKFNANRNNMRRKFDDEND